MYHGAMENSARLTLNQRAHQPKNYLGANHFGKLTKRTTGILDATKVNGDDDSTWQNHTQSNTGLERAIAYLATATHTDQTCKDCEG